MHVSRDDSSNSRQRDCPTFAQHGNSKARLKFEGTRTNLSESPVVILTGNWILNRSPRQNCELSSSGISLNITYGLFTDSPWFVNVHRYPLIIFTRSHQVYTRWNPFIDNVAIRIANITFPPLYNCAFQTIEKEPPSLPSISDITRS